MRRVLIHTVGAQEMLVPFPHSFISICIKLPGFQTTTLSSHYWREEQNTTSLPSPEKDPFGRLLPPSQAIPFSCISLRKMGVNKEIRYESQSDNVVSHDKFPWSVMAIPCSGFQKSGPGSRMST